MEYMKKYNTKLNPDLIIADLPCLLFPATKHNAFDT